MIVDLIPFFRNTSDGPLGLDYSRNPYGCALTGLTPTLRSALYYTVVI